jgi:uncharacterized protein (UPF0147 family)
MMKGSSPNDKINSQIRQLIIDKPSENNKLSQVPEFLQQLLSNQKIDQNVCKSAVHAVGRLASDETTVSMLAKSLNISDSSDDIYKGHYGKSVIKQE